MAELLVRIADKVNEKDPIQNLRLLKRGDVVVVCPDGWGWSKLERENPDWIILKVPQMSVEEAQALVSPPVVAEGLGDPLRRRALCLDLEGGLHVEIRRVLNNPKQMGTVPKSAIDAISKGRG